MRREKEMYKPKKKFMKLAIAEAKKYNKKINALPIGAVVVRDDKVIAKSGQTSVYLHDPSGHAEIAAIRIAGKKLKTNFLHDCILYSTNEPCIMCAGACVWSGIKGIVYGANIKDMEEFWVKKKKIKKSKFRMIYIKNKYVLKKSKPKNTFFLIEDFMRDECKALFKYSPNPYKK
ncbi:MAG: nucleoside deaminase [archaeon]